MKPRKQNCQSTFLKCLQALFYSRFLRIHDLCLAFCKVWNVRFIINIMFIILKSLFNIASCSTSIFSRINKVSYCYYYRNFFFQNPVILLFKILIARRFGKDIFHDPVTFYPTWSSP